MFDYKDMSDEEIRDFINNHTWKFAKSMPQMPHWYVVRDQCRNDEEFCRLVMHIRKHGEPRRFWKRTFIYLNVDEFTYWTMGDPLATTIILNRALHDPANR